MTNNFDGLTMKQLNDLQVSLNKAIANKQLEAARQLEVKETVENAIKKFNSKIPKKIQVKVSIPIVVNYDVKNLILCEDVNKNDLDWITGMSFQEFFSEMVIDDGGSSGSLGTGLSRAQKAVVGEYVKDQHFCTDFFRVFDKETYESIEKEYDLMIKEIEKVYFHENS